MAKWKRHTSGQRFPDWSDAVEGAALSYGVGGAAPTNAGNAPARSAIAVTFVNGVRSEVFGWIEAQAGFARGKVRGRPKAEAVFTFAVAACNLVRIRKLLETG